MKIWLNHTLACPDDGAYPLHLSIFTWESRDDQLKKLIVSYQEKKLSNYRNEESPLEIEFSDSTSDNVVEKNFQQLSSDSAIIHILAQEDNPLFFDSCVITPIPLHEYLQYYADFLDEFHSIIDLTESPSIQKILDWINSQIKIKINNALKASEEDKSEKKVEILKPIFQDLLFLNVFFTYFEIEEGLLVCPQCKRWYPVIKTIPRIYPIAMKREEMDLDFLEKWKEKYPSDVFIE